MLDTTKHCWVYHSHTITGFVFVVTGFGVAFGTGFGVDEFKLVVLLFNPEYSESLVKVSVSTTFGKSRSVSVSTTNKFSSLDQSRSRDFEIRVSVSVSMTRLAFSLDGLSLETMILVSLFTAMTLLLNGLSPKFLL